MTSTTQLEDEAVTFEPSGVRVLAAFAVLVVFSPIPALALFGTSGALQAILFFGSIAVAMALAVRALKIAVRVDEHGVKVVNYLRTRSVSWDRLARVSPSSESFLVEGNQYGIKLTLRDGSSLLLLASLTLGPERSEMLKALKSYSRDWPVVFDVPD